MADANTLTVRQLMAAEFGMVGRMAGNSWTDKAKDDNMRLVSVRVGWHGSAQEQAAVRQRAEAALARAGFANTVKVTHVDAVLEARNYGGTYVRVRALRA